MGVLMRKDYDGPADCEAPTKSMHKMENMCNGRMPAYEFLRQKARGLREKAHTMEHLADELENRRLGREADQLLWQLIADSR